VRILLVVGSKPNEGPETRTHDLGRALAARGHDVISLVHSAGPRSRARAVAGHGYPVWSSGYPERALPRLLRLFEPEVVAGKSFEGYSWRRCAALARRAGARTVDPTALAGFESAMLTTDVGRPAHPISSAAPELSVVIPAHNAAETLGEQLDALLAQGWAPGFEVIVADNLSTDATAELVRTRMRSDERLRLVETSADRGASVARNAGAAAAHAESLAFCDADDVVSNGWIEAMGEALRDHALVAGRVDVQTLNPPGAAASRGLSVAEGPGRFGAVPFAHSCNVGIRKEALDAVGGWDDSVHIGEDVELCLRLWRAGVELHYEPSAEVHYRYRGTESAHWRQAVTYGEAHVDLLRRFAVRQLAGPNRLHGLRNLAWLVRHWADALDQSRRPHWLWTAGLLVGHISGSVRWRTVYL
jgi:GT2 family glycosyltransferase